jgi:hypothetical protein
MERSLRGRISMPILSGCKGQFRKVPHFGTSLRLKKMNKKIFKKGKNWKEKNKSFPKSKFGNNPTR